MLQIKEIHKQYISGEFVQNALAGVSLTFRDSEFVAVLGPSGSGKTTLLNIIGGLDRYDRGDLIINGVSTRKYSDRDWDSYRNHTIGFVFQSYNLIPHQSVLSNVELALTISGIPRAERLERAKQALHQVGLAEHIHKRPNQLSGGQMQRVAIARALVNNPDILLADEPTGALDSETSQQVMALLKEVAQNRLVIMVTHNSELAETYANRIIRLQDGLTVSDTNAPELPDISATAEHRNLGRSSMSFITALSLSFNNLKTKLGRTLLTAFAGSIGIIGIALILSLSTGVSQYIDDVQKETMVSYPISIDAESIDIAAIMAQRRETVRNRLGGDVQTASPEGILMDSSDLNTESGNRFSTTENNLTRFKQYLDNPASEIQEYIGENGVVYSYDVRFRVYAYDPNQERIQYESSSSSGSTISSSLPFGGGAMSSSSTNKTAFEELLSGSNGELVSPVITDNYDLLYGSWPKAFDELVLVLEEDHTISATMLYELGFLPAQEYREIQRKLEAKEDLVLPDYSWDYADLMKHTFYLLPPGMFYESQDNGTFVYIGDDDFQTESLLKEALEVHIVGVIRPLPQADYTHLQSPLAYTNALTQYLIDWNNQTPIVKAQLNTPDMNVLNGMQFTPADDEAKLNDTKRYIEAMTISEKAGLYTALLRFGAVTPGTTPPSTSTPNMSLNMPVRGEAAMAAALDRYMLNPADEVLLRVYDSTLAGGSLKKNLTDFGHVSFDAPSSISIYADSFESKDAISMSITKYNESVDEKDRITYTDYVALLMSSVTSIIDVISYVLIAFVAVSLVVSCIMIGIITYISVLERTKEIGILRAIGASKANITQVFNAETFIVGLISGGLGIAITYLILLPGNAIIHRMLGSTDMSASLNPLHAVILIVISVILTLIGGMIPARIAAKKDPVVALRTE